MWIFCCIVKAAMYKPPQVVNSPKLKRSCFSEIKPFQISINLDISNVNWFERNSSVNAN